MRQIHVFVDGDNLFYLQTRILRWRLDAEKLLRYIGQWGDITGATFYASYTGDCPDSKKSYFSALTHAGYRVVTQQVKEIKGEDGSIVYKSNMDGRMIYDIAIFGDKYDQAVLVTGDGDFSFVVKALQARGKEVKVFSSLGLASGELRAAAGIDFIDFQSIRQYVELPAADRRRHVEVS